MVKFEILRSQWLGQLNVAASIFSGFGKIFSFQVFWLRKSDINHRNSDSKNKWLEICELYGEFDDIYGKIKIC